MSYLNFFGLKANPFDKNSDGDFLYTSKSITRANARLDIILQTGGILHLYGEYGCGKTALLHNLSKNLPAKTPSVYLDYVKVGAYGLLFFLAKELMIYPSYSKVKLVCQIKEHLVALTEKPVIIIDEAQELAIDTLSDIRMLASQDFDSHMPFVLILSSHPSFIPKLNQSIALKQRINLFCHLMPFTKEETGLYLQKRMHAAGCKHFPFQQDALDIIFSYSNGIARKINQIASICLITAASMGCAIIDHKISDAVKVDLANH